MARFCFITNTENELIYNKTTTMKKVLDKISDVLEQPKEETHLLSTIGIALLILTFMCSTLYVLISSAA
jgi:hypothetical protein